MSLTARDLCTNALQDIGAIAQGETPSAADEQFAFVRLNRLVDSWAIQKLTINGVVRTVFNLVAGQGSPTNPYTIGPSGDFNVARPTWIQDAGIIWNATTPASEIPLDLINVDEYAAISIKTTTSTIPTKLYYDSAFTALGRGQIFLWPVPSVSTPDLALYLPTAITQFADLTTSFLLLPGYQLALELNLAIDLCPGLGRPLDPVLAARAREALGFLKRANLQPGLMRVDNALQQGGGYSANAGNWLTGP